MRHGFGNQLGKQLSRLFGGIQLRLVAMIMLAVLPLVGVRIVGLNQERQQQIDAAGERALEIARRGADLSREPAVAAQTLLQVVAQVPEVITGSPESCAAFLERAGRGRGWASSFWVIATDGKIVCGTLAGSVGLDVSDRAYFRRAMDTRAFLVSDFFRGKMSGLPTSIAVLPVLDADGNVVRLLAVTLRLSWFSRLAEDIAAGAKATVLLFDGAGNLLARHPERADRIGQNFRGHQLMNRMIATEQGWMEIDSIDGPRRIYGFMKIPGAEGRIAVGFDRADVLQRVDGDIAKAAFMFVVVLFLAALMSNILARRIARPLKLLTAGAEAARRDETAELPEIRGYAEVESLATSLRELLADRRRREQALTQARSMAEQAEQIAREANERLADAIEMLPEGVIIYGPDNRLVLWNKRYDELYPETADIRKAGARFEDIVRAGLARGTCPEAVGREEEWLAERMKTRGGPNNTFERRLVGRDLLVHERRTADGGVIGIQIDITDIKRREESSRFLFEGNPLPMWVYDPDTLRYIAVNDAAIQQYGYSREQYLNMTLLDIRPPEDRAAISDAAYQASDAHGERIWRHVKADGSEVQVVVYSRHLLYEGRPAKLAAAIDVTERRRAEARITHMAHHDGLTGLANRTLFRERLEQALATQNGITGIAVQCIDLDYFKNVNDTLGHPIGDALLQAVASRLRECVRDGDLVARFGGDEFAVIETNVFGSTDASALATRIIDVLSTPYIIDGHEVVVAASVGIAIAVEDERDADLVLKHADMALYRAKAEGRHTFRFFEPEMDLRLQARRALELDLRAAYSREEFTLHYQPSIDLTTNRPTGFEALLRWSRPGHGAVSPAEFIPIAEEIGLIVPLGDWVLRQACAEAARWAEPLTVAVNLSPLQFRSGRLVESVMIALAMSGLPGERLELEITESVLFQDDDVNLAVLHQLRALGVKIAMDDFGTGYSSLSYLRRFPFDRIKIDRSFVRELSDNPDCLTITRGIIDLAASLRMRTTAEGVETSEQLELLRTHGCTDAQGYLFSAAKPASEIETFIAGWRRERSAA
jgi:diguanylate cyclase (GGDEF)-like protein/PAS domain S-box-containing protein